MKTELVIRSLVVVFVWLVVASATLRRSAARRRQAASRIRQLLKILLLFLLCSCASGQNILSDGGEHQPPKNEVFQPVEHAGSTGDGNDLPPAQNNLPVPVLADSLSNADTHRTGEAKGESLERESTKIKPTGRVTPDSRGGQFISRYDSQGNGTRPWDKFERWLVHTINHETDSGERFRKWMSEVRALAPGYGYNIKYGDESWEEYFWLYYFLEGVSPKEALKHTRQHDNKHFQLPRNLTQTERDSYATY